MTDERRSAPTGTPSFEKVGLGLLVHPQVTSSQSIMTKYVRFYKKNESKPVAPSQTSRIVHRR